MKKILVCLTAFGMALTSNASDLLDDICDGRYLSNSGQVTTFRSMNDGERYTRLSPDGRALLAYQYRNDLKPDTLFSINTVKDYPFEDIAGYTLSPDENWVLLYAKPQKRYRHSFSAEYYLYNRQKRRLEALSEYGAQEAPLFSPDSRYVAFGRSNNLFMKKLDYGTEIAITKDGAAGKISNGIPDWLYEEEFGVTRCFAWSPDSRLLAYLKFDEREVEEHHMQLFALGNDAERPAYPSLQSFKYPRPGGKNPKVSVCVYEDFYKSNKVIQLDKSEEDSYIPHMQWTNSSDQLAVFRLNRNQNRLDLFLSNPRSTVSRLVLSQTDKHYVDYRNALNTYFTRDGRYFITLSEEDGYRHIHQYELNGTLHKKLSAGAWDVTRLYGCDEESGKLFYQAAAESPLRRDVYVLDLKKGRSQRLSDGKGTHQAAFNSRFTLFSDHSSSLHEPDRIVLRDQRGRSLRVLEEDEEVLSRFKQLALPQKEFFSFTTADSVKLNGWILRPSEKSHEKGSPLLLVQYGGPASQQVLDRWSIGWEYYLVQQGYAVACVDGRGTGARGSEFRRLSYGRLGFLESRDQQEAARYLASLPYIDSDRIGIWGWSYGGFVSLMSMSSGSPRFKAGIAIAPVTDWRLYDSAYTERYMKRPQENPRGYAESSLLGRAGSLQGSLLLIHGTADDNVHLQHSLSYAEALTKAGKEFDMQLYTDKNHSLTGSETRRHLYRRMYRFLKEKL